MLFDFIFGWKWKIRRLRRRWDRLREKSLKKNEPFRSKILEELDKVEQSLRTLEEEKLTRRDRAMLVREVEIDLAGIKASIKEGEAEEE